VDIMDGKDCLDLQVSVVRKYAQHIGFDLANLSEHHFCSIMNLLMIDITFTFAKNEEYEIMLKWCDTLDGTFRVQLTLSANQV
jgi:hypothetical protein